MSVAAERWIEGRVIENRHWTETLFSLRVELPAQAPGLRFEAGQFVKLALDVEGGRVGRPFSFVNPPADPVLEFYGVIVPEGSLSPHLARLAPGDSIYLSAGPAGFLVLSEVPDAQTLWLLATGTGLAPFVSILADETVWRRYQEVVLVHAVRHARERSYRERIEAIARARRAADLPQLRQPRERRRRARRADSRGDSRRKARGGGGTRAVRRDFAGDAVRQSRDGARHDRVAQGARPAQAPPANARADHRGKLLVR